jgi:hypothetical protein
VILIARENHFEEILLYSVASRNISLCDERGIQGCHSEAIYRIPRFDAALDLRHAAASDQCTARLTYAKNFLTYLEDSI